VRPRKNYEIFTLETCVYSKYLDGFGGICTVGVGHCHPTVNEVMHKQIDELWHISPIYLHKNIAEYAEALLKKMPPHLTKVFFVNSGSEANDVAVGMARAFTGTGCYFLFGKICRPVCGVAYRHLSFKSVC